MTGYQLNPEGFIQYRWRVLWQKEGPAGPGAWCQHKKVGVYLATTQRSAESVVTLLMGVKVLGSIADDHVIALERLRGSKLTDDELIELIEGQAKE